WLLLGQAGKFRAGADFSPAAAAPETGPPPPYEIAVTPGDAEVERGSRLIVEAKFSDARVPPGATLVVSEPGENGAERGRIPMEAGLDASVHTALIAKIDSDAVYRVEFDGEASDTYRIETYIHPELESADAKVTPPAYAKQEVKEIKDTRKVSLLEGSELEWRVKVNKPVAEAELYGEDQSSIPLTPSAEDPTVLVAAHRPDETRKYRLHLVDEKARANKQPPWFTVTVKRNLPPKLDFVFPKRDLEVSAVQELPVEAKVWDDLGVTRAGATFTFGETEKEVELVGAALPGGENHPLKTRFDIEELGAKPRDLVSYHVWAEDTGPDGKPRRTASDMFFAEVRHFEDIFRESESPGGMPGEGGGNETTKLLKLQKDVMNASWKLIRLLAESGKPFDNFKDDVGVTRDSQQIAIGQTEEAIEKVEDAEMKAHLQDAREHMGQAVEDLNKSIDFADAAQLGPARAAETRAYESLLEARSREHEITRSQNPQSGQSQSQQERDQMMELEMKQQDLRYEQQSEAQDERQTAEQKENLAV
ncbi:MAG: hypothetical protein KDM91_22205, partial [Verrucomicrobiae bacterium]|nr:hypothetical protein [Verrucomicrobiae bacterium]